MVLRRRCVVGFKFKGFSEEVLRRGFPEVA